MADWLLAALMLILASANLPGEYAAHFRHTDVCVERLADFADNLDLYDDPEAVGEFIEQCVPVPQGAERALAQEIGRPQ